MAKQLFTPIRDKKSFRKFCNLNYFTRLLGDNQIVTNNAKRLPNDFKGQSFSNYLYY